MNNEDKYITIAISPHYRGIGWEDDFAGITFDNSGALMKQYTIPKTKDLTMIKKQIHLNNLILIKGDIGSEYVPDEDSSVLEEEIATLKKDKQTLTQEKQALAQENETLTQENGTLTQENGTLTQDNEALEQDKQTLTQEKQTLEQRVQTLETQVADLEAQLEAQATEPVPEDPEAGIQSMSVSGEDNAGAVYTEEEANELTVTDIKAILDEKEIEYTSTSKKSELVELLVGQPK